MEILKQLMALRVDWNREDFEEAYGDDLKGLGISGILTSEQWYCQTNQEKDVYGIALPKEN